MKLIGQKFIISLTAIALVVNSFFLVTPTAQAQLPTIEANATVYFPAFAGAFGVQTSHTIKQTLLEIALGVVRKRILDMTVDQIINYINGGGKPQFVTDWRGFLETAGQAAMGDFVQRIGLTALCSPYKLQIQLAMIGPGRFSDAITCTLGQIVKNVENFYGDFRNGGWIAYQELWAPNNNFYGTLLLAWDAKENEVAARLMAANSEAMAGQGFLSLKKCQQDQYGRDIPSTCVVTTPGVAIGSLAEKAIGHDIDYIINSRDLGIYVSAISDALINRMIRAGVQGLGGIATPSTPPSGYFSGVGCDAFFGRAKDDCLKYQNSYGDYNNAFGGSGGTSLAQATRVSAQQLDAALQPRLAGQQILQNLITLETQVVSKLNSLINCQFSKGKDTKETQNLLIQHQQKLDQYNTAQYKNSAVINELTTDAAVIGQTNNVGVINIAAENIDPEAAKAFLQAQQTEQTNNQPILIDLNNSLQTKINQCQSQ